ncbi:MAG: hypothetical protein GYB64_14035 [Chloroflexi bacterium]|nr:hypothetical protein [Chloroflexota bacterium]
MVIVPGRFGQIDGGQRPVQAIVFLRLSHDGHFVTGGGESTGYGAGKVYAYFPLGPQVANPGFEAPLNGSWTVTGNDNRLQDARAFEGQHLMLFQANTAPERIWQSLDVNGAATDAYTLTFHVSGRNITSGGQIGARVEFLSGGGVINQVNCTISDRGTFNWQPITCTATATAGFDTIRINIGWQGIGSGHLGIDGVSLTKQ